MTKAGKSYDKGGGGTAEAPEAAAPQHQNFPERAEKRRAFCPALRFHSLDFPAKRTKGPGPVLSDVHRVKRSLARKKRSLCKTAHRGGGGCYTLLTGRETVPSKSE